MPAVSGMLAAAVLFLCLLTALKSAEERAMAGWYSEQAIRFSLKTAQPVRLRDHSLPNVESVSFLSSEMDSGDAAPIKYISYNPQPDAEAKIVLPPHTGEAWTVSAWNREKESLAYIGPMQYLRELEGVLYYRLDKTFDIRVIGTLGLKNTATYLDILLYMPFDGILPADDGTRVLIAEGRDAAAIQSDLQKLAAAYGAGLILRGPVSGARELAAAKAVMLLLISVLLLLFLYFGYLWFGFFEETVYVLHLFGAADGRMVIRKVLPLAGIMGLIYLLFTGFILLWEPYLLQAFGGLWAGAGIALAAVCLGLTAIGTLKVKRLRDASRYIKR